MKLFLDASAVVAIMTNEPDIVEIEQRFGVADDRLYSGLSMWETVRAIVRKRAVPMSTAYSDVQTFLSDFAGRLVAIGDAEAREASMAHECYGKGAGHPARLNMGDCFAYACAKTNNASLLYKGDDFTYTDLA